MMFLRKMVLSEVLSNLDLSAFGNKTVQSTSKNHQTFEILTKVDFLRNF